MMSKMKNKTTYFMKKLLKMIFMQSCNFQARFFDKESSTSSPGGNWVDGLPPASSFEERKTVSLKFQCEKKQKRNEMSPEKTKNVENSSLHKEDDRDLESIPITCERFDD